MDLDLPRKALSIQGRPHKCFREFDRPAALDFLQTILLDHVRHLLLLLLALVQLLLEVVDLLRKRVETVAIRGAITDGANESGVGVLKWLEKDVRRLVISRSRTNVPYPPSFR
jgi:hypothetical protein